MRFSLRTLLLIFPVIVLLAYGLACAVAFVRIVPERSGFTVDRAMLYGTSLYLKDQAAKTGVLINIPTLDLWLQQKLPASHPDAKFYLVSMPMISDHWGRAIHCVALNSSSQPQPDVTRTNNVGLYSLGRDGKSLSHGMDEDDVNSWSTTGEQAQAMGSSWVYEKMHDQAGYYIPWTLAGILVCVFLVMWVKQRIAKTTSVIKRNAV